MEHAAGPCGEFKIADAVEARVEEICEVECRDTGKPQG